MANDRIAALAADVLSLLADEPAQLADFLAATGLTATGLRAAAGEPGFARGLLDYALGNEAVLVGLAARRGDDPARLAQSLAALVGPREVS